MKFACVDCDWVGFNPDFKLVYKGQPGGGWEGEADEYEPICPRCGGELSTDVSTCKECGEDYHSDYLTDGVCHDCLTTIKGEHDESQQRTSQN